MVHVAPQAPSRNEMHPAWPKRDKVSSRTRQTLRGLQRSRAQGSLWSFWPYSCSIHEAWIGLREQRAQRPIREISHVSFKDRIDEQLVGVTGRQQAIGSFIRPIHGQAASERDEPIFKWIVLVVGSNAITHSRPRNVVHPGWV